MLVCAHIREILLLLSNSRGSSADAAVIAYTMVGGLKATILTDWIHTFILLIIIIIFSLTAYASSDLLGSPAAVYDLLVQAAQSFPVDGNKDGSYLVSLLQFPD